MPSVEHSYAADHPAARGHFPGNPVIPGAVLLSDVVHAVGSATGADLDVFRVSSAKFLSFVRPGQSMTIEYTQTREGGAEFVCRVEGNVALSGKIAWRETKRR